MRNENEFVRAFNDHTCGAWGECECGQMFMDNSNDWDWEDGEREDLLENRNAIPVDYAIQYVAFEGRRYVNHCDCWKDRAGKIMNFIDTHNEQIIAYLKEMEQFHRQVAESFRYPGL